MFSLIKKNSYIFSPILLILIAIVTIVYFVNYPGGLMAARLLNYKEISRTLTQHTFLVVVALTFAILFSVPMGVIITRPKIRPIVPAIDNITNIAQTVPSLAVLALFYTFLGLGIKTALFALWLYTLLPILRNTSAGIQSIPAEIIEAAKGMGMSKWHIIFKIELPLALPIIMAGIRVSAVVCAGTAAMSTFIGAGGLGDLIVTGLALTRNTMLFAGGILTAIFGMLMDNIFGNLEKYLVKKINY
jgi:osmoprotectant transport system permease protein